MACKFCPKIKRYDIFWIIFVCVAMWGVNKYQNKSIQKEKIEIKEEELEVFKKLQKQCLFGDQKACDLLKE